MTDERQGDYISIAAAESAITDAGYVRDSQRHVWVHFNGKTAKVVRAAGDPPKFIIVWG